MTSVNEIKLAAGSGEPDSVLPLRIDIVKAANAWYNAVNTGNLDNVSRAETALHIAVRRYHTAVKARNVSHNLLPWADAT